MSIFGKLSLTGRTLEKARSMVHIRGKSCQILFFGVVRMSNCARTLIEGFCEMTLKFTTLSQNYHVLNPVLLPSYYFISRFSLTLIRIP